MIHQRSVKWLLRIITFAIVIIFFPYLPYIGGRCNLFFALIIASVIWIPIEILIKKIFPAPDWYAYEDENSKMTGLNLTATKNSKDEIK